MSVSQSTLYIITITRGSSHSLPEILGAFRLQAPAEAAASLEAKDLVLLVHAVKYRVLPLQLSVVLPNQSSTKYQETCTRDSVCETFDYVSQLNRHAKLRETKNPETVTYL